MKGRNGLVSEVPQYDKKALKAAGVAVYDSDEYRHPMLDEARSVRENTYILRRLIISNFKTRYKRSYLGILWSMLNPLMNMLLMYAVFSYLFRFQIEHYPIYIFSGQMCFTFFKQSTAESMNQMISKASLIRKIYLPKSLYVLSGIGINGISLVITLVLLLFLALINGVHFTLYMVYLFPALLLLTLFTVGVSFMMATIVPFWDDFRQIWDVILNLWMYLSAIFYPVSILPESLRCGIEWNPMYIYIRLFRDAVIYGIASPLTLWVRGLGFAVIAMLFGWWLFSKNSNELSYRG